MGNDFPTIALLFAIAEGCDMAVSALIQAGADVNRKTSGNGTTALMAASERGSYTIARLLIEAGAQVNTITSQLTALAVASRNGHEEVVQLLLEAQADPATFETALLFAGRNEHVKVVECIVDAGVAQTTDPDTGLSPLVQSALMLAVSNNCECVVASLIRAGAPVDTSQNPPALMIASERGLCPIVHRLLDAGANPNRTADNGLTALVVAAVNGHSKVVRELISYGANVSSGDNIPAIVLAGKHGYVDVVDALIGAGKHQAADFDKTLLSAIVDGSELVVGRLLAAKACSVQSDREMPIRLAVHQANRPVLSLLLLAGANIKHDLLSKLYEGDPGLPIEYCKTYLSRQYPNPVPEAAFPFPSAGPDASTDWGAVWPTTVPSRLTTLMPSNCITVRYSDSAFCEMLSSLKHQPDLPSAIDALDVLYATAASQWDPAFFPLMPPSLQRIIRAFLMVWARIPELLNEDLLPVVLGFTVVPDNFPHHTLGWSCSEWCNLLHQSDAETDTDEPLVAPDKPVAQTSATAEVIQVDEAEMSAKNENDDKQLPEPAGPSATSINVPEPSSSVEPEESDE